MSVQLSDQNWLDSLEDRNNYSNLTCTHLKKDKIYNISPWSFTQSAPEVMQNQLCGKKREFLFRAHTLEWWEWVLLLLSL